MLPPVAIAEIKARAKAINLSLKRLARAKGIDPSTVYRVARGVGDCRTFTQNQMTAALVEEERRLLAHLIALHPDCLATQQERAAA
jgi:predicted transcriptional regulator